MEEEFNKNDHSDSDEDDRQRYTGRSMRDTRKYFDDSSDDDDEKDEKAGTTKRGDKKSTDNAKRDAGHLMDEIFGSSDEEDFEGFQDGDDNFQPSSDNEEISLPTKDDKVNLDNLEQDNYQKDQDEDDENDDDDFHEDEQELEDELDQIQEGKEDEDEDIKVNSNQAEMSDFDLMMQKKKIMNKKARKRRNEDEALTGIDDKVKSVVMEMLEAAKKDRHLNKKGLAATNKLKDLHSVTEQLKKIDYMTYFLENGVLSAITEWLSPLPDKSLPNVRIRQEMLRILDSFPPIDTIALKESRIGGVVNYLSNHREETKINRELASKLIGKWSRTIFNLSTDLKSMYHEERSNRVNRVRDDSKKRRISTDDNENRPKPGEPGWVQRARVPIPSTTDYSVRPSYNVDIPLSRKSSKKVLNRYEKQLLKFKDKRIKSKQNYNNLPFSIEGRKLSI